MALSVSVNGGDRVPATDVVLFDNGIPIAAATQHGSVVVFADSIRDRDDLVGILKDLGTFSEPARDSGIKITGTM